SLVSSLEYSLLKNFKTIINDFCKQSSLSGMTSKVLIKINWFDELIELLKNKKLLSKNYNNIVNKLLSANVNINSLEMNKRIEEKICQIEENNIQVTYKQLCDILNFKQSETLLKSKIEIEEFVEKIYLMKK
ncbi:unnamed protein product, partial [Didymodactylos carnosus]